MIKLRISRVDAYRTTIPLKEPFRISYEEISFSDSLIVRITTDDGVMGIGEASTAPRNTGDAGATLLPAAGVFARVLVGRDPLDIEGCLSELELVLKHNTGARSAFDMALYDIAGKVSGLPLYALLGGEKRTLSTDETVGIDESTVMAQKAAQIKKRGMPAVKIKLGTTTEADTARIAAIRGAIGNELPIRIDANQGWTLNVAIQTLKALEPFGIQYCEQPLVAWDFANMARLRRHTSIPIMADESLYDERDAFKLATGGCCDYFNIKLAKSGGLHTALKINAVGEAAGIECMVGCMLETRLALTANAHLVSAKRNIRFADLDGHLFLAEDPVVGGAEWHGGTISLPETPGIGAGIEEGYLENLEQITIE